MDKNGNQKYSREHKNADGSDAPLLQFQKKVNGTYYVVEAAHDSAARQLRVVSAYMQKNSGGTGQVLNMPSSDDPQLTSEVLHGANPSANDSIPTSSEKSNGEIGLRSTLLDGTKYDTRVQDDPSQSVHGKDDTSSTASGPPSPQGESFGAEQDGSAETAGASP